MAEAIMAGMIAKGTTRPDHILASDLNGERLAYLHQRYGIRAVDSNTVVIRDVEVCFLAVKPQQLDPVLRDLAPQVGSGHLIISIAAGKQTALIETLLPAGRVVRVMPNINCLAGEGMNVFTRGTRATAQDGALVADLLGCCGLALELPEAQFDAVTALSGSGPAYFAYILDRLVDGAVKEGLSRPNALLLAEQTMLGTARLLREHGMEPAELAAAVTSAKGTTAAARDILETGTVAEILGRAVQAAARRSRELSQA
jgi:pyrroline-5-carboxylate reductase